MSTDSVTWHGASGVEIDVNGKRVMVDPYMLPANVRAPHYICVTHNDHDHFDEPTIMGLTEQPGFERLILTRSCVEIDRLDSPAPGLSRNLSFVRDDQVTVMYPKYVRTPGDRHTGPTELELDEFRIEGIDSSERPEHYRLDPLSPPRWPEIAGPYVGHAEFPNLGYLITARSVGLTFYHPGDLHELFNAHRDLRGTVDVLFFPVPKFTGMEIAVVDMLRPRVVIPIHHRPDEPDFPIPLEVPEGFDPFPSDFEEFRDAKQVIMHGHWYGGDDRPLERMEELRPRFEALGASIEILRAGKPRPIASIGALHAS
ncbi:MBL fold metallo-hydrolase [Georgenia yuyongxinii]|uniref:MBL fold metallo-hydrolase n=1 Tax=Georgenia yuyongxinii TaxID=2589797 RepID=A0A5B8C324_9MICO|nr:MBL fold metallo-hydrolase [Georgenia yuyongxinii]QDC24973.1 MBL fold metallo-hydrolase [Georgenia yuyongxinii]